MKKINFLLFIFFLLLPIILYGHDAQSNSKMDKFDPNKNPFEDLKSAVEKAQIQNKRIILDVGGEWCIWCHRLDAFIDNNEELKRSLEENFIVIKVNYSEENKNETFLQQYPKIPGFPHLFVLEKNGKFLHSQDTGELEKDNSYDLKKITSFIKKWKLK